MDKTLIGWGIGLICAELAIFGGGAIALALAKLYAFLCILLIILFIGICFSFFLIITGWKKEDPQEEFYKHKLKEARKDKTLGLAGQIKTDKQPTKKMKRQGKMNKKKTDLSDDFKITDEKEVVVSTDDHFIHGIGCPKDWTVFLINELQYGDHPDINTYWLQMKFREIKHNGEWKARTQLSSDKDRNVYAIAIPEEQINKLTDDKDGVFKKSGLGFNIKDKNFHSLKMKINYAVNNNILSDGPVKRIRRENQPTKKIFIDVQS